MSLITILMISFGVAMDATAVSFSCGVSFKDKKTASALKLGAAFGFFQLVMPVLGWLIGAELKKFIETFDHWAAFIILVAIGVKMIYESLAHREDKCRTIDIHNLKILLFLSLATSIDALMIGVSISMLNTGIFLPVISMGVITFLMSFFGALIGDRLGCRFGKRIEIAGGAVLILIGLKIVAEHLVTT
jgi:manganese efflux pump family protein